MNLTSLGSQRGLRLQDIIRQILNKRALQTFFKTKLIWKYSKFSFLLLYLRNEKLYTKNVWISDKNSMEQNCDFLTLNLLKKDSSKALLREMVRLPTCMILSNQPRHTAYGWRDALCTPVLLGLLQGHLPRCLRPGCRPAVKKSTVAP